MQSSFPILRLLALVLLSIIVTGLSVILRDGINAGSAFTIQGKIIKTEGDKPLAAYSAPEPADLKERELRQARSSRYDKRGLIAFNKLSPDTKYQSTISDWYRYIPALPTAQSDAVVLGEVTEAKGYLSNDKTGAYSEFVINVEEVMKNDGRISDGLIVAEREGAAVQLPDGRIIQSTVAYEGTPRIGRRYVFFLNYHERGETYHILTGYELLNGKTLPLDPIDLDRFTFYKGLDEKVFLTLVREAVANPPQLPREKGRPNQ